MIELTRDSYLQQMRDHLAAESEELSVLSKSGPGGPIFFIFYPKKIDPAVEFCPPPRLFGTTRKELGTRDTIILHIYHKTRHYFSLKKNRVWKVCTLLVKPLFTLSALCKALMWSFLSQESRHRQYTDTLSVRLIRLLNLLLESAGGKGYKSSSYKHTSKCFRIWLLIQRLHVAYNHYSTTEQRPWQKRHNQLHLLAAAAHQCV